MPPGDRSDYLLALCRSVPFHLVEAVLDDPREPVLSQHIDEASVLFADLVGYTALCERLANGGPEGLSSLTRVLNKLFEGLLEDAVFPYRGYVVQFGGDSMTVMFRGEGYARRAAAAALTAQRIMHGEIGRSVSGKSRELMLRVGIASGPLRLPVLGDFTQSSVVCAGPTAHRALELQKVAQPNTTVVDAQTIAQLDSDAELVERGATHAVLRGLRVWPERAGLADLSRCFDGHLEERIRWLELFVPQPLAARLRTMPSRWSFEAELRPMVILFLEIWGLDDAEAESKPSLDRAQNVTRSLLRTYRKYGGVVCKADLADRGHRVMVLFGLHRPADNDPERALLAALEATARLKAIAAAEGGRVSLRTGVHLGKVFFGAIGSEHKHDITAVGDAVNVAARAAAAAGPFEVLATASAIEATAGEFDYTSRGPMSVKGKSKPLELHVVHGTKDGLAHYASQRSRRRFVAGRVAEQRLLDEAADATLNGRGMLLSLCGSAGIGKSFLLAHLIDRWTGKGGRAVVGRCRWATKSTPLAPVLNMFAAYLGISERDSDSVRRRQIREGLAPMQLSDGAPELMALLEPVWRADGTTEAVIDLADSHVRERVISSISEFVDKRVTDEPLLYVLEDLHLGDSLTVELAMRVAAARRKKVLLVATYRPEGVLDGLRRAVHREVVLTELARDESVALVRHELGATNVAPVLLDFLVQRTRGNPGHLAESVRFLSERALLPVKGGVAMVPEGGIELLDELVPRSLEQVALARLDDLGAIERRLLRTAAAIGRRFDTPLLEAVTGEDIAGEQLSSAIGALEGEGVIQGVRERPRDYVFRDSVTRAVAYATIPEAERRGIHLRIADALARLAEGDSRRVEAVLALHRERAGQLDEAALAYARAARQAAEGGLDLEAIELVDRWEAVCDALPQGRRPEPRVTARLHLLRFVASARHGAAGRAVRLGRTIVSQHWARLDAGAHGVVDFWLGDALSMLGKVELARQRLARVWAGAADPRLRSDAARLSAISYAAARNFEQAEVWLERAGAEAGADAYRRARVRLVEGLLAAGRGRLVPARELLSRLYEEASLHGQLLLATQATSGLGLVHLLSGNLAEAREAFMVTLPTYRSLGNRKLEGRELVRLAETYVFAGEWERARPHLESARILTTELGDEITAARAQAHLGAALALTSDPTEGVAQCEAAYRRATRAEQRDLELLCELHLLRIAIERNEADTAKAALERCGLYKDLLELPLYGRAMAALRVEAEAIEPTAVAPSSL